MSNRISLPWILGTANGLLALAAVNAVYTALSSPGIWLVPVWLAAPYGAFTAWRAAAYVRRVLEGSASHIRPLLEGFVLMAGSTMAYGVYMAVRAAPAAQLDTAMFLWGLYAVPVGAFGALIAVVLMLFDLTCVKLLRGSQLRSRSAV